MRVFGMGILVLPLAEPQPKVSLKGFWIDQHVTPEHTLEKREKRQEAVRGEWGE